MYLPSIVALAAVATIGYMVGRRKQPLQDVHADRARRELKRQGRGLAARRNRRSHPQEPGDAPVEHRQVQGPRQHDQLAEEQTAAWCELFREAENMVKPTLDLASQISCAYDELRQQSSHLMTFTETRTDSLTGVSNRKALDETLESSFRPAQPLRPMLLAGDLRHRPFQAGQRPTPRADTTHVGWKTEPVRDDQGNGLKTAVASRDGLAARGPRARDGLFAFTISSTRRNL